MAKVDSLKQRAQGTERLGELAAVMQQREDLSVLLERTYENALISLRTERDENALKSLAGAIQGLRDQYPVQAERADWSAVIALLLKA